MNLGFWRRFNFFGLELCVSGVVSMHLDWSFVFLVSFQCVWIRALGFWCRFNAFGLEIWGSGVVSMYLD
jgi:hypothetical protein